MRNVRFAAAAAALAMTLSQPALAAQDFRDAGAGERRSGAFAGVSLRVPLGAEEKARPSARLQLTSDHRYRTADGVRTHRPAGLELGADGLGKPEIFFNGAKLSDAERRMGLSGIGDWVLPAVLLTAVVVGVVLLTDGNNDLPDQGN